MVIENIQHAFYKCIVNKPDVYHVPLAVTIDLSLTELLYDDHLNFWVEYIAI